MVKIRLTRTGRTHSPFYRIVVADAARARDGRFIEILGRYQPIIKDEGKQVEVNEERALYWLHQGAQPSDTVRSILRKQGIMQKWHEKKAADKKALKEAKAAKA